MPNIYLLIQNDLETGPYTLEELLQLPLQSKDLVWIIGQSEDWLNPLHIPALKHYFVEGEKEPVVRPEVKRAIINNRFIGHISGVPNITFGSVRSTPKFLDAHLLKNSEQKTLLLEHPISIALPAAAQKQIGALPVDVDPKSIAPPPTFTQQETIKPKDPPQVDISDEEEGEERFTKHQKPILIALSVVLLLCLLNFYRQSATASNSKEIVIREETRKPIVEEPAISNTQKAIPVAQKNDPVIEAQPETDASDVASVQEENGVSSVDSYLESIQDEVARQDKLHEESINFIDGQVTRNNQRKSYTSSVFTRPAIKRPLAKPTKPLHQQVAVKSRYLQQGNKKNLTGVEVTVQNNSPQVLKTVSVDVMYYKKGDHFLDKETMYFTNIHPRQSLTLSRGGNRKATSARFQLGAIQAAERR